METIYGKPPATFRAAEYVVNEANGDVFLQNVPSYNWSYGCAPTSAAMLVGYYDWHNYVNMYTGSSAIGTGLCPPTNEHSFWAPGHCTLSATARYWDDLNTNGHVDDYWVESGSSDTDPYIQWNWTEHTWADCVGDFMGSNQSYWSNRDGFTTFFFYLDGSQTPDYIGSENDNTPRKDGCHGLREFCESKGYEVIYNYNQYIEGYHGNSNGFSFSDYKSEINHNRPVLIHVTGHTMVGVGYNNHDQTVILYDTWDWTRHSMTWGGSYPYGSAQLEHFGVSVIKMKEPPTGIYDEVEIENGQESLNLNDYYYYDASFYSYEGNSNPVLWEWTLKLFYDDDEYVVNTETINATYMSSSFSNTMPSELPNYSWVRNKNGTIKGQVTVLVLDNDGYYHFDEKNIEIFYGPANPVLISGKYINNSLYLSYYAPGADNYQIYYDVNSGPPYTGTGAVQGNSPVNAAGFTTFQIDGLSDCTPYYFAIKGTNDDGASNYSGEREIRLINPSNNFPVFYYFGDQIKYYDATFNNNNYYYDGNLIIETGATVTFTGGYIYFDEGSKIIIEPGGKLILDGSTCTAPCGHSWQGIEVWGNTAENQFEYPGHPLAQGELVLKNNAVIENAWNAVTLWKPDDWSKRGGMIFATDASFINNKRSVEFIAYHNYHPFSGEEMDYQSRFTNCEFIVNDNYVVPSGFYAHITMYGVHGINIKGSEFANNMSNFQHTGYGIYTMDAGYRMTDYCNANILPCPANNLIPNTFSNFYVGIEALNSESSNTIYVNGAEFDNNGIGVQLNAVDNATVIFSNFNIGPNIRSASACSNEYGVGVDLINCNGYAVEENSFVPAQGMTDDALGVRVFYDPSTPGVKAILPNEIYNNTYDGVYIGNKSEGNSFNTDTRKGLSFLCDSNSSNTYDFYITDFGIQQMQGTMGGEAAGNKFSLNANNPYSDYNNQSDWPIIYYYNANNTNEIPVSYSESVIPAPASSENLCLSHYGGGNERQTEGLGLTVAQKQYFENQYYSNKNNYIGTEALYQSLKDGGNTSGTISDVQNAWPDKMWNLRAELLAKSPHLTKEVLMETADRTDVFPDDVIFEIFSANPDVLDKTLLNYLETKENPLPQYMVDILRSSAGTITYKTILEGQLAEYGGKMGLSSSVVIRNLLNDTIDNRDSLKIWLGNLGFLASDYQLVDVYLQDGDTTDALTLIDTLPDKYGFENTDSEYLRYKSLKQLQAQLISENRNMFMLTNAEKTMLENIVDSSSSRAGMQARNILQFVYGNQYTDCPNMPDPNTYKSGKYSIYDLTSNLLDIKAYPNPAKTWTSFNYRLPETVKSAVIEINDVNGKLIQTIHLTGYHGQKVLDTRKMQPGIYLFTLKSAGIQKTGKLIIMQ